MSQLFDGGRDNLDYSSEGDIAKFRFNRIHQSFITGGKEYLSPESGREMDWEVIITDERIIFRSPFIVGITGSLKQKNGKATIGFFDYENIERIQLIEGNEKPLLLGLGGGKIEKPGEYAVPCEMSVTAIELDVEEARLLLASVIDHYAGWRRRNNSLFKEASALTIANYKNAVLESLPGILPRHLQLGFMVSVWAEGNDNSADVLDKELTALRFYEEEGLTLVKGCPNCGAEMTSFAKFCPSCGAAQD
jgi:hypothetical protein